ncbi:hypothetical protein BDV27DRAFT_139399 [Aspergillus caelatus]|uniref:Uncharacterized protein n=1 Tax=Aspergillus caelatus TaxID=61420 RepID=A0A5N6ZIB3_9EURO|nr:uncharacterized protein BDV27DRAFT_139399 [Aspergillus caelatus]KAE8357394.1 hypothetical protein BDV27DRAFT_139399 [Aspergillus caelatus]
MGSRRRLCCFKGAEHRRCCHHAYTCLIDITKVEKGDALSPPSWGEFGPRRVWSSGSRLCSPLAWRMQ